MVRVFGKFPPNEKKKKAGEWRPLGFTKRNKNTGRMCTHMPSVGYYALKDSPHVLKLIGSDCTAFGLGCTAFLCKRYFEIRTSKVLGWISTSVLRPGTLRLRRASFTFFLVGTSSSTASTQDERYRRYITEINLL